MAALLAGCLRRYPWTEERLLAAPPRDPAGQLPKPPRPLVITYPFSTDDMLREHVSGWPLVWVVGWLTCWQVFLAGMHACCPCPSPPAASPNLPLCPAHPLVLVGYLQYRSPWGEVRIGRILEDLDSLTALIAFDHWCAGGT
jgi:hypothetical protein